MLNDAKKAYSNTINKIKCDAAFLWLTKQIGLHASDYLKQVSSKKITNGCPCSTVKIYLISDEKRLLRYLKIQTNRLSKNLLRHLPFIKYQQHTSTRA